MTVKDLIDELDKYPENNELIIIITDPNPEEAINLYLDEVTCTPEGGRHTTYLLLKS